MRPDHKSSTSILITTVPLLRVDGRDIFAIRTTDGVPLVLDREDAITILEAKWAYRFDTLRDILVAKACDSLFERNGLSIPLRMFRSPLLGIFRLFPSTLRVGLRRQQENTLHKLLDLGLLQSLENFHRLLSVVPTSTQVHKPVVFLLTCDNPSHAKRALASLGDKSGEPATPSEDADLFVLDDSRSEKNISTVAKTILSCNSGRKNVIQHVRRPHRVLLREYLSQLPGIPREVLDFAILSKEVGTTEGSSRNSIALLSAGRPVITFDDDTENQVSSIPSDMAGELSISLRELPYELWFDEPSFRKRSLTGSPGPRKSFAEGTALGQTVAELILRAERIGEWPSTQTDAVTLDRIVHGKVSITTLGSIGDPGIHSMGVILASGSESTMYRLCSNEDYYIRAMHKRELFRSVDVVTLSRATTLQTMAVGVDNTRLTAPFFPFGRNTDGLFVTTVLATDPYAWVCHLPGEVKHHSLFHRKDDISYTKAFNRLRVNDLLILLTREWGLHPQSSVIENLMTLGCWFQALASMAEGALKSFMAELVIKRQQSILAEIAQRRHRHGHLCRAYLDDLATISKNVAASLSDPELILASDLQQQEGSETAFTRFRVALERYGELLEVWPRLWHAGVERRAEKLKR